jgi:hypothetical protein
MKKTLYVLLSFLTMGLMIFNLAKAKSEQDLFTMASILENENIFIKEWSLHAREQLETPLAKDKMTQLMKQYPDWKWDVIEDEEKWEAQAVSNLDNGIHEKIQILSSAGQSYLIYEVKGKGWNEDTKELLETSSFTKMDEIFHGTVNIFSCIYSDIGDKIDESLPSHVNNLLTAFQAKEIETLEEDSFISTTAFSPLFSEKIKGTKGDMNIQIGLRTEGLGGNTTLVVGTPIITIEY